MKRPTKLRIYLRYWGFLLREFRWSLAILAGLIVGGGLLLKFGYGGAELGYVESCYAVFLQIFLESYLDTFPEQFYLQALLFVLPIVGLGAVADSVIRLAFLIFTQKRKLPEWQQMVASLYSKHFVVVGVGKVGLRIIRDLVQLHEPVVAVERVTDSPLLEEVYSLKVPVITGNGRQQRILEQAGVSRARAVILATDDDLANIDAALTAADLNPQLRVVIRLFDDTLAAKMAGTFGMEVISTAQVSSSAFIARATGRRIYQEFQMDEQRLHIIDLNVSSGSELVGREVGEVQTSKGVNVLMHQGARGVKINPPHEVVLAAGDTILVIAPLEHLVALEEANQA